MHPLSDASPGAGRELEPGDEVISPELVLVDPDLAARARARLPWPEPTLPGRRVAVGAPPAAASAPVEPAPARVADPPLQFGRRLAAAAALVPALVVLALIAELFGRSAGPLGATTTSQSSHRLQALLAQLGRTPRALVGTPPGPPTSRRRTPGHCVVRWHDEGLTLVFAARAPKNPCTEGRLVGGYATRPR